MPRNQRLLIASLGAVVIALTTIATLFSARIGGVPTTPSDSVIVTATDSAFDPSVIRVPADVPVSLTLVNQGQLQHDVSIDALGLNLVAAAGKTSATTVTLPAGTYEAYCSVPGHRDLGMTLRIEVNPAS